VELLLVLILVVVAISDLGTITTEEEKGFAGSAFRSESVGPNHLAKAIRKNGPSCPR